MIPFTRQWAKFSQGLSIVILVFALAKGTPGTIQGGKVWILHIHSAHLDINVLFQVQVIQIIIHVYEFSES